MGKWGKKVSFISCDKTINPNIESVDISSTYVSSDRNISSEIENFHLQHSSSDEILSNDELGDD